MRFLRPIGVVVVVVALGFVFVPKAGASDWDQKTIVTFNRPIEVPGAVLDPGTYVFAVLDGMGLGTRDIVQVRNKDEDQIYATFITVPKYTSKPLEKAYFRLIERPMGSPAAIEAWFYPGRTDGHEFLYPLHPESQLVATGTTRRASRQYGQSLMIDVPDVLSDLLAALLENR